MSTNEAAMVNRSVPPSRVCRDCVADEALQKKVKFDGRRKRCDFCNGNHATTDLGDLAEIVAAVFCRYHSSGEATMMSSADQEKHEWGQEGADPANLIAEMLGCDEALAEAICEVVEAAEAYDVKRGRTSPTIDRDTLYVRAEPPGRQHYNNWNQFCVRAKRHARHFDAESRRLLDETFAPLGNLENRFGQQRSPIRVLEPGTEDARLYRGRLAKTREDAELYVRHAPGELGAPPTKYAGTGRMNAAGISVFYGALKPEVCVAELRPSIGAYVVVGVFVPARALKILDLRVFETQAMMGSVFEDDYDARAGLWNFMRDFHRLITQPIVAGTEESEYIPTQAVSEYIADVLGLDGIMYASTQSRKLREWWNDEDIPDASATNIVLLRFAATFVGQRREQAHDVQSANGEGDPGLLYVGEQPEVYRVAGITYATLRVPILRPIPRRPPRIEAVPAPTGDGDGDWDADDLFPVLTADVNSREL